MKAGTCLHKRVEFYAVQKLGRLPGIMLYNCQDCGTTLSEQTLERIRAKAVAKVEPALAV